MATNNTSLSAGIVIADVLMSTPDVRDRITSLFPVAAAKEAIRPYICYYRHAFKQSPVKAGLPGADTTQVVVEVYSEGYAEGVEIAEEVRAALDGKGWQTDGLTMRSCVLIDSDESWLGDAYKQQLVFNIKI